MNSNRERKILILGIHPIVSYLVRQYEANNAIVSHFPDIDADFDANACDELFLLPETAAPDSISSDYRSIGRLFQLAKEMAINSRREKKILCHLLLKSQTMLWLFQMQDFPEEVNNIFDVYPFTMEDQWSKNVLVRMAGAKTDFPPLDREPLTKHSDKNIHLLICGTSSQAESLAVHAALLAHYPNYCDGAEHPHRTRITVVSKDIIPWRDSFVAKYKRLFDYSFYRTVFLEEKSSVFHAPLSEGCSDVEWEFVDGSIYDPIMEEKLKEWAVCDTQLLSIAITEGNDEYNLREATTLPLEIYENGVTIYMEARNKVSASVLRRSERFSHIYPFGMVDCGYDVTLPLLRMAKLLNAFYHGDVIDRQQGTVDYAKMEERWVQVPSFAKRFSNIYNVMTIPTKMRSLGHDENDWNNFYAISEREVADIAEVEHNRWNVEELILGFRPCTDDEAKEVRESIADYLQHKSEGKLEEWELKDKRGRPCTLKEIYKDDELRRAHYDIRPYHELSVDKSGLNVQHYDYDLSSCIPLIANLFQKGGNR